MSQSLDLSILKSIISNKKHALDFANEFDAKLFSPETWNFANLVVGYVRTYKELPTLRVITEKLSKGNNDKLIDSVKKVWDQLEKIDYNDREFKHDLEKLKKRFAEKQIVSIKEALVKFEPGFPVRALLGEAQIDVLFLHRDRGRRREIELHLEAWNRRLHHVRDLLDRADADERRQVLPQRLIRDVAARDQIQLILLEQLRIDPLRHEQSGLD